MIEINLLPEELRQRPKGSKAVSGPQPEDILRLAPFFIAIILLLDISLFAMILMKGGQVASLEKKWKRLAPQRKLVDDFNVQYNVFSKDAKAIQGFQKQRINWSQKLNILSEMVPSGIWFNELSLTEADFNLLGSAVSLQNDEMAMIKKFIDNLQQDENFFRDFNKLELSSVENKKLSGYEINEFRIKGALKAK
jgi:Tfp pilus assembly protein PilN